MLSLVQRTSRRLEDMASASSMRSRNRVISVRVVRRETPELTKRKNRTLRPSEDHSTKRKRSRSPRGENSLPYLIKFPFRVRTQSNASLFLAVLHVLRTEAGTGKNGELRRLRIACFLHSWVPTRKRGAPVLIQNASPHLNTIDQVDGAGRGAASRGFIRTLHIADASQKTR